MARSARSSRITVKTYRNFALATVAFTLVVALIAKRIPNEAPVAPAVQASGGAAQQPPEGRAQDGSPQSATRSTSPWGFGASSAPSTVINTSPVLPGPIGDYELSTAVTGAYESAERAAAQGRAPRMLASPAQVRAMIEESRRRSGEPTRDVPGANDDRSGELP